MIWAAATEAQNYLNLGDALSPVMVAAFSGLAVDRRPMASKSVRMSCVGTIAHGFEGGDVFVWGTGMSEARRPGQADAGKWAPPPDTRFTVCATRGPVTARILSAATGSTTRAYGDPVAHLPQFYKAPVAKRHELGVILHLSELDGRALTAGPKQELARYHVPPDLAGEVRLINTLTPIGADGLEAKMAEILSCRRIVSTSLHGMVIAETFGIPCLYFSPRGAAGLTQVDLTAKPRIDKRMVDFYLGAGRQRLSHYEWPHDTPGDWPRLIRAIDEAWVPLAIDHSQLIDSFPLPYRPLETDNLFRLAPIRNIPYQHAVGALLKKDQAAPVRW
ncbi:polysaccharide pyruvyl transferase family protein [Oleomonas cavernae]|uniref:Polysaccharide pyruvyl transferase family protein n=1 Tax=Oleomonas cavernae TaxID=2320859 RepID=A0A418WJG2_9PROT|nr:polysaccharide pyruvyl transferase family protein [Oleomonas cavernae]